MVRSGSNPITILITNLKVASSVATVSFTGASSDSASAFTLLSSPTVSGTYSPVGSANITQVGSGQFQATATTSGPLQFYRIRK